MKFIPYNSSLTITAKKNRKNPTPAETKFYFKILKQPPFDKYKFTKQKPLLNFIVDFYCSKLKLAIEIDGDSHFANDEVKQYDQERQAFIESFGIQFVRFKNTDVFYNLDGVLQKLSLTLSDYS